MEDGKDELLFQTSLKKIIEVKQVITVRTTFSKALVVFALNICLFLCDSQLIKLRTIRLSVAILG